MNIFLSGPITGLKRESAEYNFDVAEQAVTLAYYESDDEDCLILFKPTESIPKGYPREDAMTAALSTLVDEDWDYLVSLPGWKHSEGALLERQVADAVGIPTIDIEDFLNNYLGDIYDIKIGYKSEK